jgi:hypothetical protein
MRSHKQKGFALLVVVVFLMLTALVLAVLSNHIRNIAGETTLERLKVYNGNLVASTVAWANKNKQELARKTAGETIDLDVTDLQINGGKASIKVVAIEDGSVKINLTTQCNRARIKLKTTHQTTLKTTNPTKTETRSASAGIENSADSQPPTINENKQTKPKVISKPKNIPKPEHQTPEPVPAPNIKDPNDPNSTVNIVQTSSPQL